MRLPRLGREGFSEEVTFELKNGCKEGASHGESFLGGGDSICKGPEAAMKFVGWESKVARVVAAGEQRGEG